MTKINKLLYWTPRILSILVICFMALMSLDIFDMNLGFRQIVVGLFMHNIPMIVLTGILIISWKREMVGGIAYTLLGLFCVIFVIVKDVPDAFGFVFISFMLMIIGILLICGWREKKMIQCENYKEKKKNKFSPALYIFFLVSCIFVYLAKTTHLFESTFRVSLENIAFILIFVLIVIFWAQAVLFLYARILERFSIDMKNENIFYIVFYQNPISTNILKHKRNKIFPIYNFLGDLVINLIFMFVFIAILVASFFITHFMVFRVIDNLFN